MKQLIAILITVFCTAHVYAQSTLTFCAGIDPSGYCLFNNNKFFLSPDSSRARILVELTDRKTFTGTSKVIFQIYNVAKNGTENYLDATEQNVQGDWVFVWVPYQFSVGKYNVKVYNDKNELLASRSLELFN